MQELSEYMNYFINAKALQYLVHFRIITAEELSFMDKIKIEKHDNQFELSSVKWNEHSHKGWGKPDIEYKGIEIRYLWKQFKPLSFEEWKTKILHT